MIDEMFTGPSRRLKSLLEADLPNALAELGRRIESLESYAACDRITHPDERGSLGPLQPSSQGERGEEISTPLRPREGRKNPPESGIDAPSPWEGGGGVPPEAARDLAQRAVRFTTRRRPPVRSGTSRKIRGTTKSTATTARKWSNRSTLP